jgi:hypothetical protein
LHHKSRVNRELRVCSSRAVIDARAVVRLKDTNGLSTCLEILL